MNLEAIAEAVLGWFRTTFAGLTGHWAWDVLAVVGIVFTLVATIEVLCGAVLWLRHTTRRDTQAREVTRT